MSRTYLLVLFPCLVALSAQAQTRFTLSGTVTDPSGAPVSRASIRFYSRDGASSQSAVATREGSYQIALAAPGDYLVEVNATGLSLADAPRLVHLLRSQILNFSLSLSPRIESVVVTATGTPQSLNEVAKSVDGIERAELDKRVITNAVEGLAQLPAVRIARRGGPGSFTTVQQRGLRASDTAILIDGMRFRDVGSTQGDATSYLSDLLVVDPRRVEVLCGAGSSLYGTNAIGGVVNIVTDTGGGPLHGSFSSDGGGLGQARLIGNIAGGAWHDRLHYSGGVGHQNVTEGVGGNGRYRNTTGNGLIDYTIRPGITITARLLATDVYGQLYQSPSAAPARTLPATGRIHAVAPSDGQILLAEQGRPYALNGATFVPALGDPSYYRQVRYLSQLLALQHQVSAPLSYRVSYQALITDRNYIQGTLGPGFRPQFRTESGFNGRIDTLNATGTYTGLRHNTLSAGYEWEREFFDSPSIDANPVKPSFSRTEVSEVSHTAYVQDQLRLLHDRLLLSASARFQHFDLRAPVFSGTLPAYAKASAIAAPDAFTGDLSAAYFWQRRGTKLRSHVGNAYRKPSLYERFGTYFSGDFASAYGDPRLRPERAISLDAGIDQYLAHQRVRLSATYFYTRLQQVIAFDFSGLIDPATDAFRRSSGYRNTGGGLARGVELSVEAKPSRSTLIRGSYTYTNSIDRFAQFRDGTLRTPRTFPHSVGLVAQQQLGKHWDGSLELLVASDYLYPLSRRTFVFDGPRQIALAGGYARPVSERVTMRLYGRLENVANQRYYEDGFRTPRLFGVGGLKLSF